MKNREAATFLLVPLLLITIVPAANSPETSIQEVKPSRTIEFIIDPELLKSTPLETVVNKLQETVKQASLIFKAQVGPKLELAIITVNPPLPGTWKEPALKYVHILLWLKEIPKQTDFLVFVSNIGLKNAAGESRGGYAFISTPYNKHRDSIILYSSHVNTMKKELLHEIGHNCGAEHNDKTGSGTKPAEESIMHSKIMSDIRYDSESLIIIKAYCG